MKSYEDVGCTYSSFWRSTVSISCSCRIRKNRTFDSPELVPAWWTRVRTKSSLLVPQALSLAERSSISKARLRSGTKRTARRQDKSNVSSLVNKSGRLSQRWTSSRICSHSVRKFGSLYSDGSFVILKMALERLGSLSLFYHTATERAVAAALPPSLCSSDCPRTRHSF